MISSLAGVPFSYGVKQSRKWVTCCQHYLDFQYELLVHLECYILIHTPLKSDNLQHRHEELFELKTKTKQNNKTKQNKTKQNRTKQKQNKTKSKNKTRFFPTFNL